MAKFMLDGREYCGSGSGVSTVKLTQAEYDALSDEKLSNNVIYIITDSDELSAKNVPYDGSVTGLGNNVQSAIDELNSNMSNLVRFVNYSNPFKTFNTDGETWIATQDCCIAGIIGNLIKNAAVVTIDGVTVAACAVGDGLASSTDAINIYVKKGQTVSMRTSASYQVSAYPFID